jgi:hypothetical protein
MDRREWIFMLYQFSKRDANSNIRALRFQIFTSSTGKIHCLASKPDAHLQEVFNTAISNQEPALVRRSCPP